jgi:hypothetical protein
MLIGVAGPYSADTEEQRQKNLDAMNIAAAKLLEKGHTPLIGVNAALPVIQSLQETNPNSEVDIYEAIMKISLAVIDKCDSLLLIGESPGANRERDLVLSKGLKVYYSLDEIPTDSSS